MASASRLTEVSERCSQAVSCLDPDGIVINSGHFRIDLDSRRVWVRGEEIHLEEDEFEMLVFLLRHRTSITLEPGPNPPFGFLASPDKAAEETRACDRQRLHSHRTMAHLPFRAWTIGRDKS